MGIPYIPVVGLVGSDLLARRDDMLIRADPFHPERESVVVQALRPDVALLHGLRADRAGNVDIGAPSDDILLAEASRTVIVSVEEIVDRIDPDTAAGNMIPSVLIDAVVHASRGAHPGGMPDRYSVDAEHMRWYVGQCRDDESFSDYLQQTVFDVSSHDEYLERFVYSSDFSAERKIAANQ